MKKNVLINSIEKEARVNFEDIIKTGVILKDNSNFYKVDNNFLNSNSKLIKILNDLKYRNFCQEDTIWYVVIEVFVLRSDNYEKTY